MLEDLGRTCQQRYELNLLIEALKNYDDVKYNPLQLLIYYFNYLNENNITKDTLKSDFTEEDINNLMRVKALTQNQLEKYVNLLLILKPARLENHKNDTGENSLHVAMCNLGIFEQLLNKAHKNDKLLNLLSHPDKDGQTVFHQLFLYARVEAFDTLMIFLHQNYTTDTINSLLDKKDKWGNTPRSFLDALKLGITCPVIAELRTDICISEDQIIEAQAQADHFIREIQLSKESWLERCHSKQASPKL